MAFEYSDMLRTIEDKQWALADIDWEAPGAELITAEQHPKLKAFMSDLVWIEHVGARGFAAMVPKAPFDDLKQIYTYFHAEEQRHANAELALMRRWGMVKKGEMPVPNKNIRLVIEWLDRYGDDLSLAVLGSVIPALETALDGALVKFLLDEVDDPICAEVFRNINNDESRHLAVGFQVLDHLGASPLRKHAVELAGTALQPTVILGLLLYTPLLTRMITNVAAMGLSEEKLYNAVRRYEAVGQRSRNTRRLPVYHIIKHHASLAVNHTQPFQFLAESLNVAIDHFPVRLLGKVPSWTEELTYEPISR
ncbi:ferritin-like domain-containing protein [Antrihabitans sp. YC2-6]|uniref:ferritin-like domain-containing protein n=1 Tax=Antrihabitans sp. YC2-6 TaxID=2799498 RepID=UPI0018F2C4C2|nr:ferritin-like domain-containing protein [Antrihabitans sp. YC2-6]MBJ8345441.1 ferritin-like domain-containing protein [Antrihabitans sp. YC2-6]